MLTKPCTKSPSGSHLGSLNNSTYSSVISSSSVHTRLDNRVVPVRSSSSLNFFCRCNNMWFKGSLEACEISISTKYSCESVAFATSVPHLPIFSECFAMASILASSWGALLATCFLADLEDLRTPSNRVTMEDLLLSAARAARGKMYAPVAWEV